MSIASVSRVSDTRAEVTLAYDVNDPATDFDDDRTLSIHIAWEAIEENRGISAVTTVQAVVEPPPARVENVQATAGTQQVTVRWDAVEGANDNADARPYKVQWKPSNRGWFSERVVRGSQTLYTVGAAPGTEYTVRVIATNNRAPDGPPSAEARATTPAFRSSLAGTDPTPLTGANLHGAAVLIDLQGAKWSGAARHRIGLDGLDTRLWVERVELVSDSRLKVILGNRGPWPLEGGNLTVTVYADPHTWNQDVVVTVPVQAVEAAGGLRVTGVTDTTVTVA